MHVLTIEIYNASIWSVINVRNEAFLKALGVHLSTLRKQRGLSQEQLANKAQIPVNQVGRIERGEINPTVSTLYVLAQALGVEAKEMLSF